MEFIAQKSLKNKILVMAEILISTSPKIKGVKRCKKLSTKIDLTPMVDLGFLLITFFIFTTALHTPKVLKHFLPADNESNVQGPEVAKTKVLQLVLEGENKISFFTGNEAKNAQITNFSNEGLRKILLQKREIVAKKFGDATEMVVLIKPTTKSTYKNFVDVIDELEINGVTRYMLTDLSKDEKNIFENKF